MNTLELALEALEELNEAYRHAIKLYDPNTDTGLTFKAHNAIAALKEAIKQQGEPVGWFKYDRVSRCYHPQYDKYAAEFAAKEGWVHLYTSAPAIPEGMVLVNHQGLMAAMAAFVPHECYGEMDTMLAASPEYKGEE